MADTELPQQISAANEEGELKQALEAFRQVVKQSFKDGRDGAIGSKPDVSHDTDQVAHKKLANWEAEVAKGKGQMASALQQLVQADVMLSEAMGRESYRTLMTLIVSTNTTLTNLLNNTGGMTADERAHLIAAHASLLEALARIGPVVLGQKGSPAGGSAG